VWKLLVDAGLMQEMGERFSFCAKLKLEAREKGGEEEV
jgi:hypothetical protein